MTTTIQILIVDDEVQFLKSLAERLSTRGFDVITATNGFDALDAACGHALDLALVDLKMPGMDGEELLRKLKDEHPLMEVIILTGHGSDVSQQKCEATGSFSYLYKPCEMEELAAVLREAFERRIMRRLEIERDQLRTFIHQVAGESSFATILRLKEIEQEIIEKRSAKNLTSKV